MLVSRLATWLFAASDERLIRLSDRQVTMIRTSGARCLLGAICCGTDAVVFTSCHQKVEVTPDINLPRQNYHLPIPGDVTCGNLCPVDVVCVEESIRISVRFSTEAST
jgi:hypothetical protein